MGRYSLEVLQPVYRKPGVSRPIIDAQTLHYDDKAPVVKKREAEARRVWDKLPTRRLHIAALWWHCHPLYFDYLTEGRYNRFNLREEWETLLDIFNTQDPGLYDYGLCRWMQRHAISPAHENIGGGKPFLGPAIHLRLSNDPEDQSVGGEVQLFLTKDSHYTYVVEWEEGDVDPYLKHAAQILAASSNALIHKLVKARTGLSFPS